MNRHLVFFLILSMAPAVQAAKIGVRRADPARPFGPFVVATKQQGFEDFYTHTLGDVGPEFNDTSSLWAGQRVFVFVSAGNYAVSATNDVNLTFDVTIERPDGKKENAGTDLGIYKGKMDNPQVILFPGEWLGFSTDPGDPTGDYSFVVTVHDRISGENQTLRKKLTVTPFKPADLPDNLDAVEWTMNYYKNPQPELALSALRETAKKIPADKKDAWPPTVSFYDVLLTNNPWLVPTFAEGMHHGTSQEKRAIVRVLGYALRNAGKPPPGLSNDDWNALADARTETWPDPDAPLVDPSQLDMLWGRFFATGSFAPVDRIASTLEYLPFLGQIEEIKKSGKKFDTIPPDVMKELVLRSALWSFGSIAKQQPLVRNYGEWILAKEKLDSTSRLLLAKTLGHEIHLSPSKSP